MRELYRVHRRDFAEQPAPATISTWLEINEAFSLMLLTDPVVCATEIFTKPGKGTDQRAQVAGVILQISDRDEARLADGRHLGH